MNKKLTVIDGGIPSTAAPHKNPTNIAKAIYGPVVGAYWTVLPDILLRYMPRLGEVGRDPVSPQEERLVLRILTARRKDQGIHEIRVSMSALARWTGAHRQAVQRAIHALERKGYVNVVRPRVGSRIYDLRPLIVAVEDAVTRLRNAALDGDTD